ncbi:MAG: TIGR03560 family F420-dependent LLM class oxidoreductase [Dehalococcoidia bacterium]|nr:TIGR03560 family F420-dependent LLM class oxidoreductase [Dehalococcoidia bacterium]
MKFGVQTFLDGVEWQQVEDAWRFLEDQTPYESIWTYDHFVPPTANPDGPALEGWVALAALAAQTTRVRIGCLVSGVTYRNPALLGKMTTTIDHISRGRVVAGIGAAWHEPEHRFFGWDFPATGERMDRLEEAAEILSGMLSGANRLDFKGRYYSVNGAPINPPGIQRPIPLLIGGGGEKRTLRTAARFANIVNVAGTPAHVKRKIDVLAAHCRDVGRDPAEIAISIQSALIVTENQGLLDRALGVYANRYGITTAEAQRELPIGDAEHVYGVIRQYEDIGVELFIQMAQGPWRTDIYERIAEQVLSRFA